MTRSGSARPRISRGLRSFAQDAADNPGRLNLYERRGVLALVDFAHNEAGLTGLLDVARAVAGRHNVRLAFGTAGTGPTRSSTRSACWRVVPMTS